jgi:DNA-binding CsgD family transcriptional regulator
LVQRGDGPSPKAGQVGSGAHPKLFGLVGRREEIARLQALLSTVRDGGSASLVVRGEPGVGKSALLERLVDSASGCQIARAVGVEGEIDLPYAGMHQLCRSMMDSMDSLPMPQREALHVAFGLASGATPDTFLMGLAVLTLMSEVAASQPLICVVDDAQWLDPLTIRVLAFVSRRLGADSVGLVFASRTVIDDLDGVPELRLAGLGKSDSRVLFETVLLGRVDGAVRDRFLAETRGNPLAVIELPRSLTPGEAAAGVLPDAGASLSDRIELGFRRRLESLPEDTRRLLLLAAAEPVGDPDLLRRAARRLECGVDAADSAEDAGLLEIRERVSFRHPLVRSAVYQSATQHERRLAHGALAGETDALLDPDRKAWHRAQATHGPDEDVAAELERTALRARSRGGLAAGGGFLQRAALLTPDAGVRARRAVTAAEMMFEAGALDAAEELLGTVDRPMLDEIQALRAERLRTQIALVRDQDDLEALVALLGVAKRLRQVDPALGQSTYLSVVSGAFYAPTEFRQRVIDEMDESTASGTGAITEMMLRGFGQFLELGYPAGTELLRDAMLALRDKQEFEESDLAMAGYSSSIALSLWDIGTWEVLAQRGVRLARESGALMSLPYFLWSLADVMTWAGDFEAAETAFVEAEAVCDAIGTLVGRSPAALDAWRFETGRALTEIAAHERRKADPPYFLEAARALTYTAAGRYDAALEAAQRACDAHPMGVHGWVLPNFIEAAMRCGEPGRAQTALGQLVERTQLSGTDWALGLEARTAALVSDDGTLTDRLYQEAVERLQQAATRPDLARAHLLYGEWLRREGRRSDARDQLRTAHDMFSGIGAPVFAERARRELAATGETARKRADETRADLTAHEAQIARFALEGMTNPEIGARLFLSPRTVEWHLRHVYGKLGISSRRELQHASVRFT